MITKRLKNSGLSVIGDLYLGHALCCGAIMLALYGAAFVLTP
jgi:hypothetical protein